MPPLDKKKQQQPRLRARGDDDEADEQARARGKKQKAAEALAAAASASGSEDDDDDEGSSAPEVSTSEDDDGDDDDDDDESDTSSSDDDDDDEKNKDRPSGGEKKKELNVDFQFFEPAERDFHGLRALLSIYLDGKGYEVGGLVDAVIAQGAKGDGVGTVVRAIDASPSPANTNPAGAGPSSSNKAKADDEDDDADDPADPIALVTAVGLEGYRASPFAAGVRDFVLARAEAAGKRSAFEAAWDAPRSALLLNERLVNCPPQIAPPMMQYLFEEIERARVEEAEERAELEAAAARAAAGGGGSGGGGESAGPPPPPSAAAACGYAFDRYVLLTRVYADPQGGERGEEDVEDEEDEEDEEDGGKKKKKAKKNSKGAAAAAANQEKKKKKKNKQQGAPVLVYTRPEDRFFHAHSTASFTFPVEGRAVARGELRPMRLALVLPASAVAAARRELDSAVGNARAMGPPAPRR